VSFFSAAKISSLDLNHREAFVELELTEPRNSSGKSERL
jgi:hypothetical protein